MEPRLIPGLIVVFAMLALGIPGLVHLVTNPTTEIGRIAKKHPTLSILAFGTLLGMLGFVVPGVYEAMQQIKERPYLVVIPVVPAMLILQPRYSKGTRLTEEGTQLLSRGHIFAALEKFTAARPLARDPATITFNISFCRLQLWQLEEVERELSKLGAGDTLTPTLRGVLMTHLALVAALEGRQDDALKRFKEVKTATSDAFALVVLASAVLFCRNEDWAEAREQLERPECLTLSGPLRGLRDALLAWAVERLTGERRRVDPLSVFGEASPDKLQAIWPELVAFILEGSQQGMPKAV